MWVVDMPDLERWLENLNLKEVYCNFIDQGYTELEEILQIMNTPWEITQDDLRMMGISKPGYRHRILSKLKEDALGFEFSKLKKKDISIDSNFNNSACELCVLF